MRTRKYFVSIALGWGTLLFVSPIADAQVTDAIQKLLPSTVAVELRTDPDHGEEDYGMGPAVDAISYATGTIVTDDGFIVTALGSNEGVMTVTAPKGQKWRARLVASDQRSGLQLLKVEAEDLTAVDWFDGEVLLGEQVATVTCTDVDDREAATGIVAATERSAGGFSVGLLQTDVSIGPMSAGAPLANLRGELVGIFVAKGNETSGPSFAVPSHSVRVLVDARSKDEPITIERGFLGVRLADHEDIKSPMIVEVVDDSPADNAGIESGDLIIKIGEHGVSKGADVMRIVGSHQLGDQVTILAKRGGKNHKFEVVLTGYPEQELASVDTPEEEDYSYDLSEGAIQLQHPGRIIIGGKGNELYSIGGDLELMYGLDPTENSDADSSVNQAMVKDLIEAYTRAMKVENESSGLGALPAIRVQRSDLEKQLKELTDRVKSLQGDVQELTEQLQENDTRIEDE